MAGRCLFHEWVVGVKSSASPQVGLFLSDLIQRQRICLLFANVDRLLRRLAGLIDRFMESAQLDETWFDLPPRCSLTRPALEEKKGTTSGYVLAPYVRW